MPALDRHGPVVSLSLAVTVGLLAGVGAVAFRELIVHLTRLFTGYADYAGVGSAPNPHLPSLGPWFVVLAPVVAGLAYGPLVHAFAREARGHGVPEVMLAVARGGGRIRPQVAVVKALASALCIAGGGSVGREGPIVQIGSALGSTAGQLLRLDEERVTLLVACGAAGGISATFNAPLAGVFFAMEIILRRWETQSFGMVVLSSVSASVVGRSVLGDTAFLDLPSFQVQHLGQYPLFALLGVVAGLVGVGFMKVLYAVEDVCDWAWRGPEWLRPAVGGLLLGGVLLVLPQLYGVGYPVLSDAVAGRYAIGLLLLLLVGKAVATSLTIGIGGSGGVFAPSLFLGAMTGAAFGAVATQLAAGTAGSVGAYALVGMGAVFAGSARAPITAVVILFELTGEYSIILPLMLAIVLASLVSHLVTGKTIYTTKLLRRGIDIDAPVTGALGRRPVAQIMTAPPSAIHLGDSLRSVARQMAHTGAAALPVLDGDRYVGVLRAHDVMAALAVEEEAHVASLLVVAPGVPLGGTVSDAVRRLHDGSAAVPVLDPDGALVGWVRDREVLAST